MPDGVAGNGPLGGWLRRRSGGPAHLRGEPVNGRNQQRAKWRCHACEKWSYGSQGRAEEAMQAAVEACGGSSKKIPSRAYQCPYNNGWHLTSAVEKVR